jgi:2-oxoglutarate ferredoxin oxidoreductase subunit delta
MEDALGKIVINEEYCKGCGLCTLACMKKYIRLGTEFNQSGYYFAEYCGLEGECTGCALCAEMCPDAAIEVWKEEQKAEEPITEDESRKSEVR